MVPSDPVDSGAAPRGAAPEALLAVLRPLARLAVDHGVRFGTVEALLKLAMVEAAQRAARIDGDAEPPASRLSVMTGIHRKEVRRLVQTPAAGTGPAAGPTPVARLYARWIADPAWHGEDGRPRPLARRSADRGAPGFEQLARSVTNDVHPRTLLDELLRLRLAAVEADRIVPRTDGTVPDACLDGLLGLLGANVGDHLAAAHANVETELRAARASDGPPPRPPFVEHALSSDALSEHSAGFAAERARAFWQTLLRTLAPELRRLGNEDRAAGRATDRRIRIGLYTYSEPASPPAGPARGTPG